MEKFLGSFKLVPEATTGFQEYADALGIPEATREEMRRGRESTSTMTQEGDTYHVRTTYEKEGEKENQFSFQLGQPFTHTDSEGVTTEHKVWLENGKLLGEHTVNGVTVTSVRRAEGDEMHSDIQCKGATLKMVYKRV